MFYEEVIKSATSEIKAYDSDSEEFIGAFASYTEFRKEYPGAEIVYVERANGALNIYC